MGHRLEGHLSRGHRQQELKPRGKAGRKTIVKLLGPLFLHWVPRQQRRGRASAREGGASGGGGRRLASGVERRGSALRATCGRRRAGSGPRDAPEARQHDGAGGPGARGFILAPLPGRRVLEPQKRAARAPGRLSALPAQVTRPQGHPAVHSGEGKLACVCCARKQVPPDLTEDGLPAPVLWTPQSRRLRGPQEASSAHRAPSYTESRDERARPTAADGMLSPEL